MSDPATSTRTDTPAHRRGPVYVGGLDRSGKTTMSAYLSSHSQISIPNVGSNMWTYFYDRYGDLEEPANLERCMTALLSYKHVRFLQPDPERILAELHEGPISYANLFSLFLRHHAEAAGKARWGAQTGLIERYGDQLFAAYDGLKIVHMLRDPRDRYLASLERWPNGRGRVGGATARWRYSTSLGERHEDRYPHDYLIVRFEDLIRNTEQTLREVCTFLGEDYEPAMLELHAAPKLRAALQPNGATPGSATLSDEHIGRFSGAIPKGEIAFMQLHAGRQMTRHGYLPEQLHFSTRRWTQFIMQDWPNQAGRMLAWRIVESGQQHAPRLVQRRPGARMIVERA